LDFSDVSTENIPFFNLKKSIFFDYRILEHHYSVKFLANFSQSSGVTSTILAGSMARRAPTSYVWMIRNGIDPDHVDFEPRFYQICF